MREASDTASDTGATPPIGVTFASFQALGLRSAVSVAETARQLGYSSFWTAETVGFEAFSTLAHVADAVGGLDLGTGVLAAQLRTPMLAAMGAATLQQIAGDVDVLLGVGISSPVVVGRWHGAEYGQQPVARMREYLELVDRCLRGETVDHHGDFHDVAGFRLGVRLDERRPKLVLGALNERMLELAGTHADGVLLNYLPASAVAWCVEQVRAGEATAGRPSGSCTVYAYVHVGVCDAEAARSAARKDLFSYAVVPAYARAFARAGFGDEIEELCEARSRKDRDGAVAAMSDRMVDAINICGDAAHIAAAVAEYRAAGVDVPVVMPLPWGEDRHETIVETLHAARTA